jgi:hypothetical protein
MRVHRMSLYPRSEYSSFQYPSFKSAYPTVCVTSLPASGATASEFLGKDGQQSVQRSEFVSRQLCSPVMRSVSSLSASSSVALVSGQPSPHLLSPAMLTPRDTLPRVFRKQRQAASSLAFESMRRRFAGPSVM